MNQTHTRYSICWIGATEHAPRAYNSQVGYRYKYVIWRAEHDYLSTLRSNAFQSHGQSLRPFQRCSLCKITVRVFRINPYWLVRQGFPLGEKVMQQIAFRDIEIRKRRGDGHVNGEVEVGSIEQE